MTKEITEKEFMNYFRTISSVQWQELFELLEEMKRIKIFGALKENKEEYFKKGFIFPTYIHFDIAIRFEEIIESMGLLISFNWFNWIEGSKILNSTSTYFELLDVTTLCKLITLIVRTNKINDGYLILNLNDGTIIKILEAMKHHAGRK